MMVFAQGTSAIPLKANICLGGGRGVRRGVVLFSVFMMRHAWGISSMLGRPCRSSVCWRQCSTVAARVESMSFGLASRPARGVLP